MKKSTFRPRLAVFIQPMECLPVTKLPDGPGWTYEIKLDGYRIEAVKSGSEVTLYSRRQTVFNGRFGYIAAGLKFLPEGTVIDGELVALGADGRPDFNLLQNYRSAQSRIMYYAFDMLVHMNRDLTRLPLSERRIMLQQVLEPNEHVGLAQVSDLSAADMLKFVKETGLEGVVAKRADSMYQFGLRTGVWRKYRINLGQEFVIGGYTPSALGVDAIIVGFYRGNDLIYAARVRAGFVPATRREVFDQIKGLNTAECPFVNLPEEQAGRWGQGLTAEKMKDYVWLRPEAVARIEFLEWTGADHLRHTKFAGLREDKDPRKVIQET